MPTNEATLPATYLPSTTRRPVPVLPATRYPEIAALRLDPHPVVGDGRVDRGHLQRRHRDAMAHRDRAVARPAPPVGRLHQAGGLAGQALPGRLPEPEPPLVLVEPLGAELLGDRDGAHVRGVRQDRRQRDPGTGRERVVVLELGVAFADPRADRDRGVRPYHA